MPVLQHAPYAGAAKPFSIGLTPITLDDWIDPDERLLEDLADKDRLLAERREVVFAAEAGTEAAQAEVRDLLAAHLPQRFPETYRAAGGRMTIAGERRVALDADEAPLVTAARLVQEDLCLMRAGEGGYRLAAAALCFPSAWSLAEKFGKPLDGIHDGVPGYAERLATRMNRIFASLKAELPVARLNWSIYPDAIRHHPESKQLPRDWFGHGDSRAYIRVERQTLRRLPASGDILFTIKILVDPFEAFATHPDGPRLAGALREQILGLDAEQLKYKALTLHRDQIAAKLAEIAALV